jgi:Leucine-rich repeat (LRR) protein
MLLKLLNTKLFGSSAYRKLSIDLGLFGYIALCLCLCSSMGAHDNAVLKEMATIESAGSINIRMLTSRPSSSPQPPLHLKATDVNLIDKTGSSNIKLLVKNEIDLMRRYEQLRAVSNKSNAHQLNETSTNTKITSSIKIKLQQIFNSRPMIFYNDESTGQTRKPLKNSSLASATNNETLSNLSAEFIDYCFNTIRAEHGSELQDVLLGLSDPSDLYATNNEESKLAEWANEHCFSKTTKLDMSKNSLRVFPYELLVKWFAQLEELDLSSNSIRNVSESNDFFKIKCNSKLQSLDLSSNLIVALDMDTFRHLKALKYLRLRQNQIKTISLFAFSYDTSNLIELDLSGNQLADDSMEFLLFASLANLKYLNLNNNRLSTLSNHLLFNLYSLEQLRLAGNNLKSFDLFGGVNKNNEYLTLIDLSHNLNLKFDLKQFANSQPYSGAFENGEGHEAPVAIADAAAERLDPFNYLEQNQELLANSLTGVNQNYYNYNNSVEVLNLSGIDLTHLNVSRFFSSLFTKYKRLKVLNASSTRIKALWTNKWPSTIETIDLSFNLINEENFDCRQFVSRQTAAERDLMLPSFEEPSLSSPSPSLQPPPPPSPMPTASYSSRLRKLFLNNNRFSNFKAFINSCSCLLNKLKDINRPSPPYTLTIDLRHNLFESLDSISSSLEATSKRIGTGAGTGSGAGNCNGCNGASLTHSSMSATNRLSLSIDSNEKLNELCKYESNKSTLLLEGNPLICDCDKHNWWSNVGTNLYSPSLFYANREYCLSIADYEKLSCSSMRQHQQQNQQQQHQQQSLKARPDSFLQPSLVQSVQSTALVQVAVSYAFPAYNFRPIRNHLIAPRLLCPYKYSCERECKCCEFKACDCLYICPDSCRCIRDYSNNFHLVNCTSASLNASPSNLPLTITELLLNGNKIKRIAPHGFFDRSSLVKLDLSNNQMQFIEENSFHSLAKLRHLNLSHNSLQILLGYEFRELVRLEELNLESNQIQFISNLTFVNLANLKYLNLKNNLLRHSLELELYFQANALLINLLIDPKHDSLATATSGDIGSDKNSSLIIIGGSNVDKMQRPSHSSDLETFAGPDEIDKKSSGGSGNKENAFYYSLIRSIPASRRLSSGISRCIFEKTKLLFALYENDEKKNRRLIDDEVEFFKAILTKHFKPIKSQCHKEMSTKTTKSDEIVGDEQRDSAEVNAFKASFHNKDDNDSSNNNSIDDEDDDDEEETENEPSPRLNVKMLNNQGGHGAKLSPVTKPLIVLNYITIVCLIILLLVLALALGLLLAFLIVKHQKNKIKNTMSSSSSYHSSTSVNSNLKPDGSGIYLTRSDEIRLAGRRKTTYICLSGLIWHAFIKLRSFRFTKKAKLSNAKMHALNNNKSAAARYIVSECSESSDKCSNSEAAVELLKNNYKFNSNNFNMTEIRHDRGDFYYKPRNMRSSAPLNYDGNYNNMNKRPSMDSIYTGANHYNNNKSSNYNLKNKLNNQIDLNSFSSNKRVFVVYNKLDYELVHNVIAPLLREKPYCCDVRLEHDELKNKWDSYSSSIVDYSSSASIAKSLISTTTTTAQSASQASPSTSYESISQNNISCQNSDKSYGESRLNQKQIERHLELIKTSKFVLFVMTNNLLTDVERKLAHETPHMKKRVLAVDNDLSQSKINEILYPKSIHETFYSKSNSNNNSNNNENEYIVIDYNCSQEVANDESMHKRTSSSDEANERQEEEAERIKFFNNKIEF